MQQIPINWWAVIVATLIRMAVGSVWYSSFALGPKWQALSGVTAEQWKARMPVAIPTDAIMSLIMAFALANIIGASGIDDWLNGGAAGFWVWLGFMMPVLVGLWAHEGRSVQLVSIMSGFNLVALVLMGILLGVWK